MKWRVLIFVILMMVLAACQIIGGDSDNNTSSISNDAPILIDWDHDPASVVFRAEVTGGENADAFFMRNDIPLCSIYGDRRIVWSVNTDNGTQILFDQLTDDRIRGFVQDLAVREEIYSYSAESRFEPPSDTSPVVEQLTLAVNEVVHTTDSFSDWDISYFQDIVDACHRLSEAPTIFEPQAAWISAVEVVYDPGVQTQLWDPIGSGLDFDQLATSDERRWITDERLVRVLWHLIRQAPPNLQFAQGEGVYHVAIEVPNVNPSAPPPPSD